MNEIDELKKILTNHEERLKVLEQKLLASTIEDRMPIKGFGITKLAERVGLSAEKLDSLYDADNNTLTLLRVEGSDEAEKTKRISLMVILGYKYIFGNESVLSSEIKRNVAENRVPLNNFASYLNEMMPSQIRRIGKPKSKNTKYKLTTPGEVEAKEMVKQMCNVEK